ncbi:MAG: HNH endonuclease [Halobacteriales archaeon]
MVRRYRNGWWHEQKYWDEGLTQREIAEECDVSARTIRKYMQRFGVPTRDVEGEHHPLSGERREESVRRSISESLSGRELSEEWREKIAQRQQGSTVPEQVRKKISESLTGETRSRETREAMSESTAGERNPNWQGGYSRRYGAGWAVARERVRRRDDSCRHCGYEGDERQFAVHHIVPVRRFREADDVALSAAHDERNLVLLCNRCHPKADRDRIEVPKPVGFEQWRSNLDL